MEQRDAWCASFSVLLHHYNGANTRMSMLVHHAGAVTGDDLEKLGWMIELAAKQSARAQVPIRICLAHCNLTAGKSAEEDLYVVQGLRAPITTIAKLQAQSQTLHLCVQRLNGDRCRAACSLLCISVCQPHHACRTGCAADARLGARAGSRFWDC